MPLTANARARRHLTDPVSQAWHATAGDVRRRILDTLASAEASKAAPMRPKAIAKAVGHSHQTVADAVRHLERVQLVKRWRVAGNCSLVRLTPAGRVVAEADARLRTLLPAP